MIVLNTSLWTGTIILTLLLFIICFGSFISPFDPYETNMNDRLKTVSATHLMGTDELGRDLFSRILYATRTSVNTTLISVSICLSIGIFVGCISGYMGGLVDQILMRIVDMMMAFPTFILAVAITGILGSALINLIIAISLTSWVGYARIMRSSVLILKETAYTEAALMMGASDKYIIIRHILPNAIHTLISYATLKIGHTMLMIVGLSFIGLGAQPPEPELGSMLNEATAFIGTAPHLFIFPGFMIILTTLGFNLIGDGLRDYFDPRMGKEVEL